MVDWKMPMQGGCRCGKVRFTITAPPMFTAVCHCTGCQKMSASAYSTNIAVPQDGFSVITGGTVAGGLRGDAIRHEHCDHCKSWVYTRYEPATGFVNVRATMVDDPRWYFPFIEMYVSEALPWARVAAMHSYPTFPPPSDYHRLLSDFAGL